MSSPSPKLTHYLFRYPAKFHPPIARLLVGRYTKSGQTVLDPFCGSGSLLVEAMVGERRSIGVDVDPLAVFVSRIKTTRFQPRLLKASLDSIKDAVAGVSRGDKEYAHRMFNDISEDHYRRSIRNERLTIPEIPNLIHWFRRYVIVDLARMLARIDGVAIPDTHRDFFRLVFASIIRNSSNADPVPVSGLEVTSHMKNRDALGRLVNPVELFVKAADKAVRAATEFTGATRGSAGARIRQGDARELLSHVRERVDAVITSPPYHNAVDYYRRHQLEMYWLGLTNSQAKRLQLRSRYIGRSRIPNRDMIAFDTEKLPPLAELWDARIRATEPRRANDLKHYVLSMAEFFAELKGVMAPGAPAVFVVGHSQWNGTQLPTTQLFSEAAAPRFELIDKYSYPVKNRYMSYARRNGASIDEEHVLVFKRNRNG